MTFKLGTCTTPIGRRGPWAIEDFTLTEDDVSLENLRARISGKAFLMCQPGDYKRLVHDRRGVVMSNTPMEVRTNREAFALARGRVLINGLGMGMLLEAILSKPDVSSVRVVEIDQDVIDLVGPHFAADPRLTITKACAYEFKPPKGEVYEYVWHDVWDTISGDNLPAMGKLVRKYSRLAPAQGVWSRDIAKGMRA